MPMAFKRYFMPPAFNPDGVFGDVISIGFTPGASVPLSHWSFWLRGFFGSAPLRGQLRQTAMVGVPTNHLMHS